MPGSKKKNVEGNKKGTSNYNGWMFARDFFGQLFGLFNSGRAYTAFGLLIVMILGLVVYRLPQSELSSVLRDFFSFARSSVGVALSLFVASNVGWIWLFRKQGKLYQRELDRVAEIRRELMHLGPERVVIREHRTSDGEQREGYLLPPGLENPPTTGPNK